MTPLAPLRQWYLRRGRASYCALMTRLWYGAGNVTVGARFRADGVPRILVDRGASLEIGDDVEFRDGVEIRVHGTARVVIGNRVRIDRGVRILAANDASVTIDADTRIGLYSVLNGGDSIYVGTGVLVSGFVYLQTSMHAHEALSTQIRDQGYIHAPVSIGDGTWLAAHVVVMPGVTIGGGAIVGSNAVVTRDVEPNHVVAGVPAATIKIRK